MTTNTYNGLNGPKKFHEQLKDRRDLRLMLIQKKENLEKRIKEVEQEIGKLTRKTTSWD